MMDKPELKEVTVSTFNGSGYKGFQCPLCDMVFCNPVMAIVSDYNNAEGMARQYRSQRIFAPLPEGLVLVNNGDSDPHSYRLVLDSGKPQWNWIDKNQPAIIGYHSYEHKAFVFRDSINDRIETFSSDCYCRLDSGFIRNPGSAGLSFRTLD